MENFYKKRRILFDGLICTFMVALLPFLSGCFSLRSPAPLVKLYVFENPVLPGLESEIVSSGAIVVVGIPTAAVEYDTEAMAYTRNDYQLEYFSKSRWLDKPARLLQPSLVQALLATGNFKAVVRAPTLVRGDYLLNFELLRLRQEFTAAGCSNLSLGVRVEILDGQRRVLQSRCFAELEPVPSADAAGGVAAANRILQRLLPQLAKFCVATVAAAQDLTSSKIGCLSRISCKQLPGSY